MPDWLRQAVAAESPLPLSTLAVRLLLATAFGVAVAAFYRLSHGRLARDSRTLMGTLVLLTILLAMVTMVIGESVARAFGLVGALSIVRFRTVVQDTRDTAFVIFAVVVGMAVGTGLLQVAAVGTPIVGLAAVAASARLRQPTRSTPPPAKPAPLTLTVRLGAGHPTDPLASLLRARARSARLTSVATARQGAAIDLSYTIELDSDDQAAPLILALNALEGVQAADLQRPSA